MAMTRTEAFSNCINKEFIKILILIIEPKLTLLMINTKDVFHTPRQQAHCTRAISRVFLPRMTFARWLWSKSGTIFV